MSFNLLYAYLAFLTFRLRLDAYYYFKESVNLTVRIQSFILHIHNHDSKSA